MPTYEYLCEKCDVEYEIIKSLKEYKREEQCPTCGNIGNRIFSPNVYFTGTKIEDSEWNIGLGAVTKSKKHRDEIAKRKNLVELGNENPETVHNIFDKQRADKRKKAYDDI